MTDKDMSSVKMLPAYVMYAVILATVLFIFGSLSERPLELQYSAFVEELKQGDLTDLVVGEHDISGEFRQGVHKGKRFTVQRVEPELSKFLSEQRVGYRAANDSFWSNLFMFLAPAVLVLFVASSLLARGSDSSAPGLMSIQKSGAKVYREESVKTTFADVAGVDEAKEELSEVLSFLKEPERYRKLGGHLPRGILLVGPPGTGKTLLARAVAGEANVPFFSISGSQFVEMFVGVGAARVRDLFAQAKRNTPCIIFIDELDALGKARAMPGSYGTHDEKEQTLNQLLVEMDGFDPMQGIVLLAATNRPEILDAALLRAGRFDKHVLVDRPDKSGRAQILRVHLKSVAVDASVEPDAIAALTPGFTGADLANLINEAVLHAVRRNSQDVQACDFTAAMERIVAGPEKKHRLLDQQERQIVAFHECGHAIVSCCLPGNDVVQKVSIIPRGIAALGYTWQRPVQDKFLASKEELESKLAALMGGRAAEIVMFARVTTGAADDLVKATELARDMVMRYGMCPEIGPIAYALVDSVMGMPVDEPKLKCSEETAERIDAAVKGLIERALERALQILSTHKAVLTMAAELLLAHETISGNELQALLPDLQQSDGDAPCKPPRV